MTPDSYLFRFMTLFEIDRFIVVHSDAKTIRARIEWDDHGTPYYDPEDEKQDIEWDIQALPHIDDALAIADFLKEHRLMQGDKISLTPEELQERLNWSSERFDAAISDLLDFKVDMVDDGERTDYFFVHF